MRLLLASLLSVTLFALIAPANSVKASANFAQPPFLQNPPTSQPDAKSTAEALAEATQLSRTVVRLHEEGKSQEALPLAKRALELREAALGADHESVQAARLNLAELYTALKKYGDARKIVERLLMTHEKTVGPDDAGAAIFLDKLAFLAYGQQDFGKAEAAYKRALAIREKTFGRDHAEFAASLYALGEFYRFTDKFEAARPLYEEAALLREKLLGREHPDYKKTRDKFFCLVYETTRDNDEREKRLKEFAEKLGKTIDTAQLEGRVLNGRALSLPRPPYPDQARRLRLQGTVVIRVTIDELGQVIDAADMCNGHPFLVQGALQSARGARFSPTTLSGQPVKVTGVITYNFVRR